MFRIRKIHDVAIPIDRDAIEQIQQILKLQFPLIAQADIEDIPDKLLSPLKYQL